MGQAPGPIVVVLFGSAAKTWLEEMTEPKLSYSIASQSRPMKQALSTHFIDEKPMLELQLLTLLQSVNGSKNRNQGAMAHVKSTLLRILAPTWWLSSK